VKKVIFVYIFPYLLVYKTPLFQKQIFKKKYFGEYVVFTHSVVDNSTLFDLFSLCYLSVVTSYIVLKHKKSLIKVVAAQY
jgi:hypothetical protein